MGRKLKKTVRRLMMAFLFFALSLCLFLWFLGHQSTPKPIQPLEMEIPKEYIPVYKAAEEKYKVPWQLLAAHHRVETKFSTMDPMLSPAGAEGPMQFMPCTFVGWSHPSCEGLGKGNIPENDKTNPAVIKKYGGYGVDANGDGKADPYDLWDAVFSAANYLARNGAADGDWKRAVYAYNHSNEYVEDVLYFANVFSEDQDKYE
ncbi:membrane-bound lytic murein transglycosylase B [Oikeobacillus pervagus]|uniref:Membrane-bound lytic murein transglycosylase B n=1 Tax=Oikeobacillus pervagus TaxID=1325931 RepID=A0AAJ1T051_9BACI|nr:lytic transglycosylase domain-containing protein [Oikeobacillus pervagus]MDQ0216064.1 membrane-bound lytic murein transglycosylase B [Oikeobacillus pervagus]